jgi:hypothetical protein
MTKKEADHFIQFYRKHYNADILEINYVKAVKLTVTYPNQKLYSLWGLNNGKSTI